MDTVTKRMSMLEWGSVIDPLPWANALTDKGERQTFIGEYGGNELSARGGGTTPSTRDPGVGYWGGVNRTAPRKIT